MGNEYIITGSCSVKNHKVILDGKEVWEGSLGWNPGELLKSIYKHFEVGYLKYYKMDPLTKLGFITAEILLKDRKLDEKYAGTDIGIAVVNKSSSIDIDRAFQETIENDESFYPSPALFVYTLPNIMTGEICIRHKFKGENTVFLRKDFSAEFIQDYVSLLFQKKKAKACITGWVEINDGQYRSLLMLVENADFSTDSGQALLFTAKEIKKLF